METFQPHPGPVRAVVVTRQQDEVPGRAIYAETSDPYFAQREEPDSNGLLEYWRMIRRHTRSLCAFTFCGTLLGFLVGLPIKPVYQVSTSFEVLNLNEDFMNMKQANPVSSSDYSFETSEEQTQVKLLQSDALLDRVIEKLDPNFNQLRHKLRLATTGWRKLLNMSESARLSDREKLLNQLGDSLKVRATPRTRVIEITAKSTDPHLAVDFANTIANEFIEQNIESRWKTTQRVGDWLSRELSDERANLRRSENALQAYARDSGLIFTDENTNVATEKLQQLQQQLTAVTADRITKQARYELAQHSPPDSLPDILSDDNLQQSAAKITDLRRQVADLSAIFTPDYSKLKRLEAELVASEVAFQRDRANIEDRVKNDYTEALNKEKLLEGAYDNQTREVTGQDEKAIQYNILKREVDSHRQLYDTMLQQLKQSSIATALHASNVRIVDPAELPEKPIWPNFKILSALGLAAGLFLGLGAAILGERADRTLQHPGEVQLWTRLLELGTIPSASAERKGWRNKGKGAEPRKGDDKHGSVELITWNRKPSLMAEAFRSTLTSILFVNENGTRPRVLVLTSANASDGKTTVVTNLAIAMAESRRRVLIVDADLRRPRVHEFFDLPNEHGLGDLLSEQTLSDETVRNVTQKTKTPEIDVITSGCPTQAATNLLHSPNLSELITRLRKEYDMVLIDTPPMLQMADARVIGRLADAVVLVVRAEQTTRDALIAANQRFSEDRIRVLGAILNDWNPRRFPGGYGGYYSNVYYSQHINSAIT